MRPFSDFHYDFSTSCSTAILLTGEFDRIARSGATRVVTFRVFKAFARIWHAGLRMQTQGYGTSGRVWA